jgi:phage terminase large subunit-like protein
MKNLFAYLVKLLRPRKTVISAPCRRWIDVIDWLKCEEEFNRYDLKGRQCFGGIALANIEGFSVFVLVFPPIAIDPKYYAVSFCFPARQNVEGIRLRIGELNTIFHPEAVGFDPWEGASLMSQLYGDGLPTVKVRQGFSSLSSPTKRMKELVLWGLLAFSRDSVLLDAIYGFEVRVDASGNVAPILVGKSRPIGALINALAVSGMSAQEGC